MTDHVEPEEHGSHFEIFGWEPSTLKIFLIFSFGMIMAITLIRILYDRTKMKIYVPESCLLIIIGILAGLFVLLCTNGKEDSEIQKLLTFSPDLFL